MPNSFRASGAPKGFSDRDPVVEGLFLKFPAPVWLPPSGISVV